MKIDTPLFSKSYQIIEETLLNTDNVKRKESFKKYLVEAKGKLENYKNYIRLWENIGTKEYLIYMNNFTLIKSLDYNKFYDTDFVLSEGLDVIKNIFNNIPLLILFTEQNNNPISGKAHELFDALSTLYSNKDVYQNNVLEKKKSLLDTINRSSYKRSFIQDLKIDLIFKILLLIIPPFRKPKEAEAKKKYAEYCGQLLDNARENIKLLIDSFENKSDNDQSKKIAKEFLKDIDYFILWVLRRVEDFEVCKQHGLKCISKYNKEDENTKEPRFYHGLALNFVSQAYDVMKKEGYQEYTLSKFCENCFTHALKNLYKAKVIYYEILTQDFEKRYHFKNLIIKNLIAVINQENDILLKFYQANFEDYPNQKDIVRTNINEKIKPLFKELKEDYNNYPSLVGTEAELEYLEALYCNYTNNKEEAIKKIQYAKNRADQYVKQKSEFDIDYHPAMDNLVSEIEKLHEKLIR